MKNFIITIICLLTSLLGFSQNKIEEKGKESNTIEINKTTKVKKQYEKIQITDNGVVVMQQDYTPEYPTPLNTPKPSPLTPSSKTKN